MIVSDDLVLMGLFLDLSLREYLIDGRFTTALIGSNHCFCCWFYLLKHYANENFICNREQLAHIQNNTKDTEVRIRVYTISVFRFLVGSKAYAQPNFMLRKSDMASRFSLQSASASLPSERGHDHSQKLFIP